MELISYASSPGDIRRCAELPDISEVLLEPALLACEGTLTRAMIMSLADLARSLNLKPILVWNTLKTDSQLDELVTELGSWDLSSFSAVRVRDIGAAQWLTSHYPDLPLQLILETGNHNLEALRGWCAHFKDSLTRIILSIELTEERLIEYCQALPVQCEVLGAGRICLFYSPRKLLSNNFEDEDFLIEVTSSSDDSHGRPFPTVESSHGTFMYLDKDQFILDRLDGLRAAGMHTIRLDLRHLSDGDSSCTGITELYQQIQAAAPQLRKNWPRPTLAPFFKTNKTTAQFSRLKSPLHVERDQRCLAQVVATEKGRCIAYYTLQSFNADRQFIAVLPTGHEIPLPAVQFKSIPGDPLTECPAHSVITSKWVGKITPGTLIKIAE